MLLNKEDRDIRTSGRYTGRKAGEPEPEMKPVKKYTRIGRKDADYGIDPDNKTDPDGYGESYRPDHDKKRSGHRMSGKNEKSAGQDNRFFRKRKYVLRETARSIKKTGDAAVSTHQETADPEDMNGQIKSGTEKVIDKVKKTAGAVLVHLLHFAMSVVTSLVSMIGIVMIVAVIVVVIAVSALQDATYDFITDDEQRIREVISQVSSEFTEKIDRTAAENGCKKVVTNGSLAPWKDIIAFWWTLKSRCSDSANREDYYSGNDHDDIEKLFYEFNLITSEVITEDDEPVLLVTITNVSMEDMIADYALTPEQKQYLDNLLADDEVWSTLLYSGELAGYAAAETGQGRDKYAEWYPLSGDEGWNMAFLMYVLDQAGYLDTYVTKTKDMDTLMHEFMKNGYMKYIDAREGDMIFLSLAGTDAAGIITGMDSNAYYITLGDYTGSEVVCEITVAKNNSNVIHGFAGIDISSVAVPGNSQAEVVTAGELIWPASGCYTVTSRYGARSMFGRNFHYGMDIACPVGTPILAAASGTVTTATYGSSPGNYIVIDHGDFKTVYMHNSSLQVTVGEQVSAGQVIALSGNTGDSTGPHCHFGLSIGGYIDPAPYLGLPEGFEGDASVYLNGGQ